MDFPGVFALSASLPGKFVLMTRDDDDVPGNPRGAPARAGSGSPRRPPPSPPDSQRLVVVAGGSYQIQTRVQVYGASTMPRGFLLPRRGLVPNAVGVRVQFGVLFQSRVSFPARGAWRAGGECATVSIAGLPQLGLPPPPVERTNSRGLFFWTGGTSGLRQGAPAVGYEPQPGHHEGEDQRAKCTRPFSCFTSC